MRTFASLRLGENRRLNKEVHFSPMRKDAKTQMRKRAAICFSKTINAGLYSRRRYAAEADRAIFVKLAPEAQ